MELQITLKPDGILSYLSTCTLEPEKIDNSKDLKRVFLTPNAEKCYPHYDSYSNNEDSFLDFSGEIINTQTRCKNLLNKAEVVKVNVSCKRYEAAINVLMVSNGVFFMNIAEGSSVYEFVKLLDSHIRDNLADPSGC